MNFVSSFRAWLRGNATAQRAGVQSAVPSGNAYEDTNLIGPDAALQVSTVWACVKLLVETIASLPLFVYRTDSKGQRTLARDDELYAVLHDSPNKRMTAQEFWEFMLLNLVLRGNAYARIERGANGRAYALWPLAADQIEVKAMPDGSLVYAYGLDSNTLIYLEEDILHIKGIGNGVVGMSPLDYMRASVGLAIGAQNHTAATYRKQARRPGILMTDKVLGKEQREALRNSFGEIATGGQKELYILEASFKFEPINMSPADIQLLETRRFAVEDLARWFGVPSVLINDTTKTTTWGTGVEQIIEGFYKFTLRPQLERIEQAIARRVLTSAQRASGLHAEFSFDALLRASLKDRMEIYAKGAQNGIYSRNECRQLENLPPVVGADDLTVQVNLVPIGMLGKVDPKVDAAMKQEQKAVDEIHQAVRNLETRMAERAAVAPAPAVTFAAGAFDIKAGNTHVTSPPVQIDNHLPASQITVENRQEAQAAPSIEVRNEISVEPTPITLEAKIENQMPDVMKVRIDGSATRVTTSSVERDRDGNIITTTQIERDA